MEALWRIIARLTSLGCFIAALWQAFWIDDPDLARSAMLLLVGIYFKLDVVESVARESGGSSKGP